MVPRSRNLDLEGKASRATHKKKKNLFHPTLLECLLLVFLKKIKGYKFKYGTSKK